MSSRNLIGDIIPEPGAGGGGGASNHTDLGDMPSSSNTDHDGRYNPFVQDAEPTPRMIGDLWIDTDASGSASVAPIKAVRQITGNDTATASDYIIEALITTNSVLTLIDPTTNSGSVLDLVNDYSSSANLTFSESIDGDSAYTLEPGEVVNVYSNGTEYKRNA